MIIDLKNYDSKMPHQSKILEFIINRHRNNESTAIRHIHRRFGLDYDESKKIISEFLSDNLIYEFYDDEYEEYRFLPKLDMIEEPS